MTCFSTVVCITHIPNYFGANRSLLASISAFSELGFDPFVVIPSEGEFSEVLRERRIRYSLSPVPWWYGENRKTGNQALRAATRKLVSSLYQSRLRFVYSNSLVTPLGYFLSRRLNVPHLWHVREFGEEDYNLKPLVSKRTIQNALQRSTPIFNSAAVREKHLEASSMKGTVIFNPVSIPEKTREPLHPPENVAILGHLHPQKGQLDFLKFWHKHQTVLDGITLHIVGDGHRPFVEECHHFVKSNRLTSSVTFHGYRQDISSLLQTFDVIVVPSHCEAFGRVTAEALAAGKLVIARNSGGTPEIIQHGVTGLLYQSEHELKECFEFALQEPESVLKIVRQARAFASQTFSQNHFLHQIRSVLQSRELLPSHE